MTPEELLAIDNEDVLRLVGGDEFVLVEYRDDRGGPTVYAAELRRAGGSLVATRPHASREGAFAEMVALTCELINDRQQGEPTPADVLREIPDIPQQHRGGCHPRKPRRPPGP